MPSTESLDNALSELPPLPPHTCPDVDRMLKTLQSEERDADAAAMASEDPDAGAALQHASSAINDAANALDHERDVAAALRAGCDARESLVQSGIRMCEERDERIQTLEAELGERDALIKEHEHLQAATTRLLNNLQEIIELQRLKQETSNRVIKHLGEKIRKPWWRKLADTGKRLWWEKKARGRAKTIQRLRGELSSLKWMNADLYDALLLADGILIEHEWETGPFGQMWCPSCHVTDDGRMFGPMPKHEHGCRIGKACEVIRWALKGEALQQGMDPRKVGNGRREFQT